ncbi:MAG: cytidylate kinase family protein, partial [Planctomycetota bacterium]
MPERDYRSVGGLSKVVERQVRNWELARSQKIDNGSARTQEVEDFVTIANICGAGGNEVAAMLSEKLNWPLFDRQILSVMAGDDDVRARLYETMDERDLGWIENTFRS